MIGASTKGKPSLTITGGAVFPRYGRANYDRCYSKLVVKYLCYLILAVLKNKKGPASLGAGLKEDCAKSSNYGSDCPWHSCRHTMPRSNVPPNPGAPRSRSTTPLSKPAK